MRDDLGNDFGTSKITVNKPELLHKMQINRDQHQHDFELAWAGFVISAREEMQKNLALLDQQGKVHLVISLPTPTNHVKEYDRVIAMLQMSVADEVQISEGQFVQYVQDEWSWKGSFTQMVGAYGSKGLQGAQGAFSR